MQQCSAWASACSHAPDLVHVHYCSDVVGACFTLYDAAAARTVCVAGVQELQLLMECAELDAATTTQPHVDWDALETALHACPYTALVEFNTHHSRTLLTLAERSLEAGLVAAGAGGAGSSSASGGGSGSSSSSRGGARGAHRDGGSKVPPLDVAAELAGCLAAGLDGGNQGGVAAEGTNAPEAVGEAGSLVSRTACNTACVTHCLQHRSCCCQVLHQDFVYCSHCTQGCTSVMLLLLSWVCCCLACPFPLTDVRLAVRDASLTWTWPLHSW
jgi:hypothetical protein